MYTEEELIKGCKKGNAAAQEALFKKYAPRMRYICLRYAQTSFEAEDIFQDAFVKVFSQISKYSGSGSLEGWIKRIFINTAIDYYKKGTKLREQVLDDNLSEQLPDEEEAKGILSEAAENLSQEDLLTIINSLPDGYRMVFNLFAVESYSHQQIADALGITTGTSKSQLAKARKMLRYLITEQLARQTKTVQLKINEGVIKLGVSA